MHGLDGKVAIVTGGATLIGTAVVAASPTPAPRSSSPTLTTPAEPRPPIASALAFALCIPM